MSGGSREIAVPDVVLYGARDRLFCRSQPCATQRTCQHKPTATRARPAEFPPPHAQRQRMLRQSPHPRLRARASHFRPFRSTLPSYRRHRPTDPDTGLPRVILEVRVSKGTSLDPGLMQLILYGRQLMAPLPGHSHSAAAAAPGASAAAAPPGRVLQLALVSVVWNASADVLLSGLWESRCDTPDREHAALGATLRLQEEGRAPARARDVVFGEGVDVRMSDRVVGMDNAVPTREALRRADLRFRQW